MPAPSLQCPPGLSQSNSTHLAASSADRCTQGSDRRTCTTPLYTRSFPCTCIRIFSRSSGATAVRDLPHATPPISVAPQVARPCNSARAQANVQLRHRARCRASQQLLAPRLGCQRALQLPAAYCRP